MRIRNLGLLAVTALAVVAFAPVTFAATTERVSGNTVDTSLGENGSTGWWFERDANNANGHEFNDDQASIGNGSLYAYPLSTVPAKKFIAEYFALETLDDPSSFSVSYDYFLASSGASASQNFSYLNVYVNQPSSSPTKFYDCRFDFVPAAAALGSWQTVAITGATPASTVAKSGSSPSTDPCPATIGGMPAGSTLRMFSLNLGDTSANDAGLSAYFDKVVYSADGDTITFDFDPEPPQPATKDDCKDGGWTDLFQANGSSFKNQGDCIQYANTGK